jgi:hypothetical protein
MDPAALSGSEWSGLGSLLSNLWIVVALVVFFGTNMMVGHILIPSLVASAHLPGGAQKARPLFYVAAIASVAVAIVVLIQVIQDAEVLERFWSNYWI